MDTLDIILLIVGGYVAGVVNAMAGGGSALTVPILVLAGVPGVAANGSNRVGILTSTFSSIVSFRNEGKTVDKATLLPIVPPALIGAAVGAFGISQLTNDRFEQVFGLIIIPVVILTVLKPKVAVTEDRWSPFLLASVMFLVGIYSGAIQAGVGLVMLAVLNRSGIDLITANVVKVIVNFSATLIALPVFVVLGQVRWGPAIILAIGLTIGGWMGAKFAVRGGVKTVRVVMVVAATALALNLLGFWSWLFDQF